MTTAPAQGRPQQCTAPSLTTSNHGAFAAAEAAAIATAMAQRREIKQINAMAEKIVVAVAAQKLSVRANTRAV